MRCHSLSAKPVPLPGPPLPTKQFHLRPLPPAVPTAKGTGEESYASGGGPVAQSRRVLDPESRAKQFGFYLIDSKEPAKVYKQRHEHTVF